MFLFCLLEHKIRRKTSGVAFHLLVESLRGDAVDGGEVGIKTKRECAEMATQRRGPEGDD